MKRFVSAKKPHLRFGLPVGNLVDSSWKSGEEVDWLDTFEDTTSRE